MPNRCRVNYGYVEKTSLSLSFALFMLTRNATAGGAADWFGWSTEQFWYTRNWHWQETAPFFTKSYGAAKAAATAAGQVWTRQYERATFTVDWATLQAKMEVQE